MKLTATLPRSFSWNSAKKTSTVSPTKADSFTRTTSSPLEKRQLIIPVIVITEPNGTEPRKEMGPIQLDDDGRRTILPAPMSPDDASLFNVLKNNMGKDLSTVTLPVTFNEPLSLLQRLAEDLEYTDLLDQAVVTTDDTERLGLVAAFAVSSYACTRYRSGRKPFNPMLTETFEYEDRGFRFISEKVCHHPPVMACHAQGNGWEFWATSEAKNKFTGKSFELIPIGWNHLKIGHDHYRWDKPSTFVRNIISGTKYLEHIGPLTIENSRTGDYCHLEFKEPPLFSWSLGKGKKVDTRLVEGVLYNKDGVDLGWKISGSWDKEVSMVPPIGSGAKVLWQAHPFPIHVKEYYGFTSFATALNQLPSRRPASPVPCTPAPTDSRYRPDQRALEEGQVQTASKLKESLEESQRKRKADHLEYKPRWFKLVSRNGRWIPLTDAATNQPAEGGVNGAVSRPNGSSNSELEEEVEEGQEWEYVGGYWEAKEKGWDPAGFLPLW